MTGSDSDRKRRLRSAQRSSSNPLGSPGSPATSAQIAEESKSSEPEPAYSAKPVPNQLVDVPSYARLGWGKAILLIACLSAITWAAIYFIYGLVARIFY